MKEIVITFRNMAVGLCLLTLLSFPFAKVYGWIKPSVSMMLGIIACTVLAVLIAGTAMIRGKIGKRTVAIACIIAIALIFGLMKYVDLF